MRKIRIFIILCFEMLPQNNHILSGLVPILPFHNQCNNNNVIMPKMDCEWQKMHIKKCVNFIIIKNRTHSIHLKWYLVSIWSICNHCSKANQKGPQSHDWKWYDKMCICQSSSSSSMSSCRSTKKLFVNDNPFEFKDVIHYKSASFVDILIYLNNLVKNIGTKTYSTYNAYLFSRIII